MFGVRAAEPSRVGVGASHRHPDRQHVGVSGVQSPGRDTARCLLIRSCGHGTDDATPGLISRTPTDPERRPIPIAERSSASLRRCRSAGPVRGALGRPIVARVLVPWGRTRPPSGCSTPRGDPPCRGALTLRSVSGNGVKGGPHGTGRMLLRTAHVGHQSAGGVHSGRAGARRTGWSTGGTTGAPSADHRTCPPSRRPARRPGLTSPSKVSADFRGSPDRRPVKTGGVSDGTRTRDHRHHKPGLYQLSYAHRDLRTAQRRADREESTGCRGRAGPRSLRNAPRPPSPRSAPVRGSVPEAGRTRSPGSRPAPGSTR